MTNDSAPGVVLLGTVRWNGHLAGRTRGARALAGRTHATDRRYECREEDNEGPFFTLKGWHKPIHDHFKDRPHGTPDLVTALAVSCNVYFAQLGIELGPAPFEALRKAGLDDLEIVDVINGAAFFNWANRLMLSLGEPTPPAKAS